MALQFDPLNHKYPSVRYPVYARGGMVNCSSPQASAAGLEVLRKGGNAMDAAVAAAGTLTVVKPVSNGIGSDAFALIWSEKDQKLFGLNSSGRAPALATVETILASGQAQDGRMPRDGWLPVTVPGAPKAWAEVVSRFGRLSLAVAPTWPPCGKADCAISESTETILRMGRSSTPSRRRAARRKRAR